MPAPELPRKLSLLNSTTIVVGTIIGSGIFLVPNLIARNLSSPGMTLGVWIFTGVLSLFGALAYAELGAMLTTAAGSTYICAKPMVRCPPFCAAGLIFWW